MLKTTDQISLFGQLAGKLLNLGITYMAIISTYGRKYIDWQYLNISSIC